MVDFVLAYPQADVKSEIYMKLPRGIDLGPKISRLSHVLKLIKNIYGLKQAGHVWNLHLHKGLQSSISVNQHMIHAFITKAMW